uniref:Perforin-1-like n=1 Tax=Myripristis murdjan TaxID=586833 RepID=A0A667XLM1_9TELE
QQQNIIWIYADPPCLPSSEFTERLLGTPQECKDAEFVPGHNLGGEGFDIVKMERKGAYVIDTEKWERDNGTCILYRNIYLNKIKQKIPVAMADWRALSQCKVQVSSTVYESAESLVNDSTSTVTNDWKVGLDIPPCVGVAFGGSHSNAATFAMQKSKQDMYTFFRHAVNCGFYSYRMVTDPPHSHEFDKAINSLPSVYSKKTKPAYYHVIETYGTHYIMHVILGGALSSLTSIKTCQATMNGLTETEVMDCLTVEASVTFPATARLSAMYKHCQEKKKKMGSYESFNSRFSERTTEITGGKVNDADLLFNAQANRGAYSSWLDSLKTIPDVIRYKLKPLHTILRKNHPARAGLKNALKQYIISNALVKKCSRTCKVGHRSSARDRCACVCNSDQVIKSNCCPAEKGLARLKVFKLSAEKLYGDIWSKTDGIVMVKFGNQIKRTSMILNNDNPKWPEMFDFGPIKIDQTTKLEFSVYDADIYWNSDLLGKCSFYLHRGKRSDSCMFKHGTFFFTYMVVCAPSLGGSQCRDHIPSPMEPSLAKVFYTRNGVLAGESGLQQFKWFKQLEGKKKWYICHLILV